MTKAALPLSFVLFMDHLPDCMDHLGFEPCKGDDDRFRKPYTRQSTGEELYKYILLYVDDVVSDNAELILKRLDKYFLIKPCSMKRPDTYLGSTISLVSLPNGINCWTMASSKYIQGVMKNVVVTLKDKFQLSLPKNSKNPFPIDYRPEVDVLAELDANEANYYQTLIGIGAGLVELGRIDIHTEVSMLSSHLELPRRGHMVAALHLFSYLKSKHNAALAFDPTYPTINHTQFISTDWRKYYGNVEEKLPIKAPAP